MVEALGGLVTILLIAIGLGPLIMKTLILICLDQNRGALLSIYAGRSGATNVI